MVTSKDHVPRDARDGRSWRAHLLRRLPLQPLRCRKRRPLGDLRLSDIEPRFVCKACGKRGAEVRPDFNWNKSTVPRIIDIVPPTSKKPLIRCRCNYLLNLWKSRKLEILDWRFEACFLSVRLIGSVWPPVAENPQAADKSAVPPQCFLTVQRGAQPVGVFNPAHGEVGGSAVPDILFPLFAAGMVGGLLFLAFG